MRILRSTSSRSRAAAGILQRVWRANMQRKGLIRLVQRFFATGIEEKSKISIPTQDRVACKKLIAFFNSPTLLNSTHAMLRRICFLSSRVHGGCVIDFRSGDLNSARLFVTAYAINAHISRVGILCNPIDITLIKSARALLGDFNELVRMIMITTTTIQTPAAVVVVSSSFCKIPKDLLIHFNSGVVKFNETYMLWEKSDHRSSWNKIIYTLVSLYFTYFCQSVDASARLAVKDHIDQRRAGLMQVFGHGTLAKFDADLSAGRFGLPPITDPEALETLASDPRFFLMKRLEKMILVQEIITDVNFKTSLDFMKESPYYVYSNLSRNSSLYWSTLYLDLTSSPPSFEMLWQCLLAFKEQLHGMVADEGRKAWVDAATTTITAINNNNASLVEGGGKSWEGCVSVLRRIVDVIQKIQMPVRDRETASGWSAFQTIDSAEVLIEALQFVSTCLKRSEIDAHNVKILLISHALSQNGVKYITEKFNGMLESGILTMERTKLWVAAALKNYMATAAYNESNIRPLAPGGVGIVLYIGLHVLLFRRKLLNHEKEFPEILIFDVWRICSLQRKMRIDAAALCTLSRLRAVLIELRLLDTADGKLVMERVVEIFKSIEYGTRGLDDNSDVFLMPDSDESVFNRIKVELAALLPQDHHHHDNNNNNNNNNIASRLLECMDTGSAIFRNTLNRLANLVKLAISSGGVVMMMVHDEEHEDYFQLFALFFASRVKKNIKAAFKIFETMRSIYTATPSLMGPLIESEVAKLM